MTIKDLKEAIRNKGPVLADLQRRIMPHVIANSIIGVSPMQAPKFIPTKVR